MKSLVFFTHFPEMLILLSSSSTLKHMLVAVAASTLKISRDTEEFVSPRYHK